METVEIDKTLSSGTTESAGKNLVADVDLDQKQLPAHGEPVKEPEDKGPGRPTDYSPEMVKKAYEYLDSCIDEDEEEEFEEVEEELEPQPHGGALKREHKVKAKVKLPTKGGLAVYLGVSRDTLYEWAKVHPEFSDIMERLGSVQEDRLINKGLSGDYNPTISKVLLTKHGYNEKIETDLTSKGEKIEGFNYIVPNGSNNNTNTETASSVGSPQE